jgi:hypothetical protein
MESMLVNPKNTRKQSKKATVFLRKTGKGKLGKAVWHPPYGQYNPVVSNLSEYATVTID